MDFSSIQTYEVYLSETFKNLINKDPAKEKYKDEVFALLQSAYAPIGGIHGSGFRNPDDMVANIPFWKLVVRSGKVVAVAMYKDSSGRKRVAIATDGTEQGKAGIRQIVTEDYQRAYFEISDRSLSFQAKTLGYDFLKKYAKTPAEASKITGDSIEIPSSDDPEVKRHPELAKFFYRREIGGTLHTKIMFGTTGKKIVGKSLIKPLDSSIRCL